MKPFFGKYYAGIEWGQGHGETFEIVWSHPTVRHWGLTNDFYDGPFRTFGFWLFHFCWSTRWTPWPKW